jgi:hypothetical protein
MALVKPLYFNTTEGIEAEINPAQDTVAFAQVVLNGVSGVGINANGQSITGLPTPVNASDASTKGYVDSVVQGLNLKPACIAVATTNVTMSGTQSIDGVALAVGNRVLLTGQSNGVNNGIWVVASGNWTRPADLASGASAAAAYTFIEEGTANADNGWVCTSDPGQDTVGTAATTWTQFSGAGQVLPGSGLAKYGNTLAVALAPNAGLQFSNGLLNTYLTPQGGLASDANGMRLVYKAAGTASQTVGSDASGVSVLGLPSLFTIAGTATSANVTAPSLGTLTAGTASVADALHTHQSVLGALACVGYHVCGQALVAGDPVAWSNSANTLVRGDATVTTSSRIIGIAAQSAAAGSPVPIVKRGLAQNVFVGGTPGAPVFLNSGGGLTATAPTGASLTLVRVGWLSNATDVDVAPVFIGQRSA